MPTDHRTGHTAGMSGELDAAERNRSLRAAVLEALDLADRAGVGIRHLSADFFPTLGARIVLQGGDDFLSATDALRIALRAVCPVVAEEPTSTRPFTVQEAGLRSGGRLRVICRPTIDTTTTGDTTP